MLLAGVGMNTNIQNFGHAVWRDINFTPPEVAASVGESQEEQTAPLYRAGWCAMRAAHSSDSIPPRDAEALRLQQLRSAAAQAGKPPPSSDPPTDPAFSFECPPHWSELQECALAYLHSPLSHVDAIAADKVAAVTGKTLAAIGQRCAHGSTALQHGRGLACPAPALRPLCPQSQLWLGASQVFFIQTMKRRLLMCVPASAAPHICPPVRWRRRFESFKQKGASGLGRMIARGRQHVHARLARPVRGVVDQPALEAAAAAVMAGISGAASVHAWQLLLQRQAATSSDRQQVSSPMQHPVASAPISGQGAHMPAAAPFPGASGPQLLPQAAQQPIAIHHQNLPLQYQQQQPQQPSAWSQMPPSSSGGMPS